MADFDDLAAKYGVGSSGGADPYADLVAKYGGGRKSSALAGGDAGPSARRAAAGMSPGPREYTDEQLGIANTPERGTAMPVGTSRNPQTGQTMAMPMFPSPQDPGGAPEVWTNNPEEAGDTMVQAGLLGAGAGRVAGPVLSKLFPAPLARVGAAAAEGGTASKASGGDFTSGAALGGGLAAMGPLARFAAGGRNVVKDVTKGATKAPSRIANEVKFKAEDGNLNEVLSELPQARRAVMTKARTNPAAASEKLGGAIDDLVAQNDEAFAAIQNQHGGVPLSRVTERFGQLEAELNQQGRGVAADAAGRLRDDLTKRYGREPDVIRRRLGLPDPDPMLTAQQIRNIRNDMGTIIDPSRAIAGNTKRQALGKLYAALNEEIEAIAAKTEGVDVGAFKARNNQISTLIPVQKSLKARAESQADLGLLQRAKNVPGNMFRRGARELDYMFGDLSLPPPAVSVQATQSSLSDRLIEFQRMRDEDNRRRASVLTGGN
jgi:hypothetical protein